MHFNLRNWLGLGFLIAVALITVYWSRMQTAELVQPPETAALPEGYYVTDAVLVATDETGAVRYRIAAGHAEEQPARDRLVLRDVEVEYRAAGEAPWRVSATFAEAPTDRSYLDLSGNVRLVGVVRDGRDPVLVETTRLKLDPLTWVASSKEAVSIMVGRQRLSGVGLRADLREDHLELESELHGQILR